MSCLWMSLSLLLVLHHSVSSDDAVNVSCPPTVEVKAGDSKTINCSIRIDCEDITINWRDTNGSDLCKNGNYICDSDHRTYVSLTIRTATREENVTVDINSSCGMDWGDTRVKLKGEVGTTSSPDNRAIVQPSPSAQPSTDPPVTAITLCVIGVIIIIVGILFFLHRAKNRRKTSSHQAETQEEMSLNQV